MTNELAQQFKSQGNAAFQAKDYKTAVDLFTKAIEADPEDAVLYSNRSGAWASMDNYEEALADAEICVSLNPNFVKGWSRKGLAEFKLGKSLEAIESYTEGLKRDPNNAACRDGLVAAKAGPTERIAKERFELEVAMNLAKDPKFSSYMEQNPDFLKRVAGIAGEVLATQDVSKLQTALETVNDPRIQEALAKLFKINLPNQTEQSSKESSTSETKKSEASGNTGEEDTKKEVPSEVSEAEELKNQGNAAYKKRDFEKAAELYEQAFEKNPREILYLNNLAAVFLEKGDYEKCLEITQKALDMRYSVRADFKKVAKVYNRRAVCFVKMNDYPKAIESYKKSLTEDNDRFTRAALSECERAYEKAQELAYMDPQKAEEHRIKGNALFREKAYPEAKKEYDEGIKRNPNDAKLYSNRAAVYMQLFEFPSALKDCNKALELDPEFCKAWARKGACHLQLKEPHKALDAYQKGLKIDPNNEECRNGLANTMIKIRETSQSKELDEEQLQRAAADPEIQQILGDPQMQIILGNLQQNPQRLMEYMRDERVANAINKLMAAGILRTA